MLFRAVENGSYTPYLEVLGLWSFFSEYLGIAMCWHQLQELGIGSWVKNSKMCAFMELHSRCLIALTYAEGRRGQRVHVQTLSQAPGHCYVVVNSSDFP